MKGLGYWAREPFKSGDTQNLQAATCLHDLQFLADTVVSLCSMNAPVMVEVGGATDPLEVFTANLASYACAPKKTAIKPMQQLHHAAALHASAYPQMHVFQCISSKVYNHKGTIPAHQSIAC